MVAFPGSFPYFVLLNIDERDLWFWARRGVRRILSQRLSELRITRLANDMEGDQWLNEVNTVLDQMEEIDNPPKPEKEKDKLASGWQFFKDNPIG